MTKSRDNSQVVYLSAIGFLLIALGFVLISLSFAYNSALPAIIGIALLATAATLGIHFMTREGRSETIVGIMLFLISFLVFLYYSLSLLMWAPQATAVFALFFFGFFALFLLPFIIKSYLRQKRGKVKVISH